MDVVRGVKRSFWRGLAALLPALLTIIVLVFGLSLVHNYAGQHVNWLIVQTLHRVSGIPLGQVQDWYAQYYLVWLGSLVAVIGLCVAVYFVGTFLGARLIRLLEGWLLRMPLVRKIYPGAKQVSDFFFSERKVEFRRVVAIEFPRKGMWMIGFVTGHGFSALARRLGTELLSVFVPTTPAPVTGFVVTVPKGDVVDLPISVDEAVQFLISAGVIMPPAERAESLAAALLVGKEQKGPEQP